MAKHEPTPTPTPTPSPTPTPTPTPKPKNKMRDINDEFDGFMKGRDQFGKQIKPDRTKR